MANELEIAMPLPYYDVDVRPILREGGEPFSAIMAAVDALAPGQSLRLLATFKPIPCFMSWAISALNQRRARSAMATGR